MRRLGLKRTLRFNPSRRRNLIDTERKSSDKALKEKKTKPTDKNTD